MTASSNLLIGCVVALALLLGGASWSAHMSARDRDAAVAGQHHAVMVLRMTDQVKIAALNAIRGERGYVVTGEEDFLDAYLESVPAARLGIARLLQLTRDHPEQHSHALTIQRELEGFLAWLERVVALQRAGRQSEAREMISIGEGRNAIETIIDEIDLIENYERRGLDSRMLIANQRARANEIYQYLLSAIGLVLLVVALIAATGFRRAMAAERHVRNELRRRAMTDDLTGLANRRELMAALERATASARRYDRPLALAILDIDHFKKVNDTHGHPVGDAVIRKVALTASEIMRGEDTVGRLGGEEFAVVLPDCSALDAYAACERLRVAMRETDLELETGHRVFVTLSVGIAVLGKDDTSADMIARADAALYDAKHGGRDRVLLAA
ncbi:diguanylate cyclase [Leptolyngbya sp. 15MV]|nr:diguanylate cyclase [Leptolyngbya sp. 15MV]